MPLLGRCNWVLCDRFLCYRYAPQLSYTKAELAAVVAHGRMRGVRVIPEFDLPAHMASWAQGYEELITDCPSVNPYPQWPRYYSPADVTNPRLYAAITEILGELAAVFPDSHWHVGGDEPHFACWEANANVTAFMKARNLTSTQLYATFEAKYAQLVADHGKQVVGWEEIQTTSGTHPPRPGHHGRRGLGGERGVGGGRESRVLRHRVVGVVSERRRRLEQVLRRRPDGLLAGSRLAHCQAITEDLPGLMPFIYLDVP